ncbi:MAG: alanine--tRNA ligase [Candidatus Atribacteria bacterium]|nr:alanine--tRNA ligase [Candidatus Atribacteria bacterium]
MKSGEIREAFLDFFVEKGHERLPSASLIPDDPTLLLTIAGMVPFKPIFLGKVRSPFRRVCTVQKCVRVSDLDRVGYTSRHHTFFEMLGNFSFGDYFKKEACQWAWEFLTRHLGLPPEKLWVSVHHRDNEAFSIWQEVVGVPATKIIRLGDEDNFWSSGPVGPCGYCSEIYYDTGVQRGCGKPDCKPGCDCDRYLEVWNLVFMEFDRQGDGTLIELPRKNIDTGMGLERIASVMQNAETNFETDLFQPIIVALEKMSGEKYGPPETRPFFRIIADHVRAITFLVADGVYPANEGRGYVLRRLIRRAYRQGKKLALSRPFLYELSFAVIERMSVAYPELRHKERLISQVVFQEEKRFEETMSLGMEYLGKILQEKRTSGMKQLSGAEVFKLYDTYGFPPDLTREILAEEGFSYSEEEFAEEMQRQKERARQAHEMKAEELKGKKKLEEFFQGFETAFLGYECQETEGRILALSNGEDFLEEAQSGDRVMVVLDRTPFYPEKGGQEWDTGWIFGPSGKVEIQKVLSPLPSLIVHEGIVREGTIKSGEKARAVINARRRKLLETHHSVTHLLHQALREVLGEQVKQAGSHVAEEGLRFDFTHFAPLSPQELEEVESRVNAQIFAGLPVHISYSTLEEIQRRKIVALFEEKYESVVRVVRMGNYSAELCGGTHLRNTSEAGLFKIISESSIGSGLRRIEAVAGVKALEFLNRREKILAEIQKSVGVSVDNLPLTIENLEEENRKLKKALLQAEKEKLLREVVTRAQHGGEKPLVAYLLRDAMLDLDQLKEVVDEARRQGLEKVMVLGILRDGRIQGVTAGLGNFEKLNLSNIVKAVIKNFGGGGGGKPHLAQFGGLPEKDWEAFLSRVEELLGQHEKGRGA